MKKLIVLLLALTMIFVLSACGSESEQSDKDSQNAPNIQSDLNDLNENLEDLDDVLSALIPDGWDENNYGAYIYGVWDADFLPECFPEPIEGVKVDQTTFKDYDHDTLSGSYAVGPLYYESKEDYRSYGLFFYANQDQLDAFTAAVEAKGLNGGLTEEGEWTYYNYFGNGWFMEIFVRATIAEEDYEYQVSVTATDSVFELPESISGIPLPQCGMTEYDYNKNYTIQDFTNGYDDVDFDLSSDTLPTEYYAAWFNYHCATNQDAIDYAQKLKDLGWEVEWESDGEDGYRCCLQKDGIYAISNYYDYDCILEVGFSDMVENLSY